MYDIQWEVKYFPDYPTEDGPSHAFFSFATSAIADVSWANKSFISSHPASGCLIDHQSRISDIEIPDSIKLKCQQDIWFLLNVFM